jgi:hypothetical protein
VPLLGRVAALLRQRATPFAVIGAAALAVHGVSRSTRDVDLLVTDLACLGPGYWASLRDGGVDVSTRTAAPDDPLAGVVRMRQAGETVDVIVGRPTWQRHVVGRATGADVDGVSLPVARPADLVLLKLYAGGPQDAWDIQQLLGLPERAAIVTAVDAAVVALPADARALWQRVRPRATC